LRERYTKKSNIPIALFSSTVFLYKQMNQLTTEINDFMSQMVNDFISQKTKIELSSYGMNESLMFDNENNQKLFEKRVAENNKHSIIKLNLDQYKNKYRDWLNLQQLETYFEQQHNIKFYYGYEMFHDMNFYDGNQASFWVYTNTYLYFMINISFNYGNRSMNAIGFIWSPDKEYGEKILTLSNTPTGQSSNGKDWYIQTNQMAYNVPIECINTRNDEIDRAIKTHVVRNIHPQVYVDYMNLCGPTQAYHYFQNISEKEASTEQCITELNDKLNIKNQEINEIRIELKNKNKEINGVCNEFHRELHGKNTEFNELINKKNQEINEIRDELEQQKHYNTILRNSVSSLKKELAYNKAKIQSLDADIQTNQQIYSDWYWYWPTENEKKNSSFITKLQNINYKI